MIFCQTNTNYLINEANGNISVRESKVISDKMHNKAKGSIEVASNSEVVTKVVTNESGEDTKISDSSIYGQMVLFDSKKGINIEDSFILADYSIFLHAVKNFLSVNSNITLDQYPYKLFLHKEGVDAQGNPLIKCGFSLPSIQAIGIIGQKGLKQNFTDYQFSLVDSKETDLGIFPYLAAENKKAIIIDAASGVIIGSNLDAKNNHVIIKATHGIEILPLNLYNTVMFSGGFNAESIKTVITKIEAGFIDIDGGSIIHLVGALLRATQGSLKADYIIDEPVKTEITAKNRSLQELSIWLGDNQNIYDMVVNNAVVPTRLEFSEVTKIDVGKGKVNLFYPYQSKEVYLRQRQGDLNIDRDVHFPNQLMAVHLDQGKIFFGIPKTESFLLRFFGIFHLIGNHHTTEHVKVSGNNLGFTAGSGIELHGEIKAASSLSMESKGNINIASDTVNFGTEVKQSVLRADNAYITADNIEIAGSLINVKNYLKLVSHNDIKVIPIALIHRYSAWCGDKTFTKEMAIKQVVTEINAGIINIDAGRATEFTGSLISAEGLNIKAQDLKIADAKEIFSRQIEFQGQKKWHGGGKQSWSDYTYAETVVPTEINVKKLKVTVDRDATIAASQIFVKDEVLTKIGGNLVIKDGYNLHIHDYYAKKYSILSFGGGSLKLYNSKSIKDLTQQTEGLPTLVCTGGIFYGIVDGRMHVLGSTIIGKDIHLVVPNGLKLEASKYTDTNIVFVNETGAKLGFYHKGKGEFGTRMGVSNNQEEQEIWRQYITKTVVAAKDTLSILVRNGTFEQISSDLAARIIHVEARNWVARTYDEQIVAEHIKQHAEAGVKLAIKQTVTSSIDKAKTLINKKGTHVIDNLDRIFKAYDTYKSFAMLPTHAVTGGSYAYMEAKRTDELTETSIAVDNTINGETIIAKIVEDIRFQGVQMQARDVDLAAENFVFETSKDTMEKEYNCGTVDIDIGISNPALSTGNPAYNSNTTNVATYHQNYIKASGNLKITLTGDGKFKGVSLEGASIDIKAKNLILESVQDIISSKLSGANFHVGLDQGYGIEGFGGYGEKGREKSAWTNQIARIIGTQVVNIVVKETLELAGSLIANSEEDKRGNITDKGNLSVNCGRMIVKTIHDYDNGLTLGIGASYQVGEAKDGEGKVKFHHAPLKVSFKDQKRTIAPTIGRGTINTGSIIGDQINRDIASQIQETKNEKGEFDAPIHADMLRTLTTLSAQTRTEGQELPAAQLAKYFIDVADKFKGAVKDTIIAGAKLVGNDGAEQRAEQLFNWQYGTKLKAEEVRSIEAANKLALAKVIGEIRDKEKLDLSKKEQYEAAINQARYTVFFEQLKNELTLIKEKEGEYVAEVSATLRTYKAHYLKEQEAAQQQNRPVKEFSSFIREITRNNVYGRSEFAEKIHPAVSSALGSTELVFSSAQDQEGTNQLVKKYALEAASKEVEKGKAEKRLETINKPIENPVDIKLKGIIKEFIKENPKYANEIRGVDYKELKRQLEEAAKDTARTQLEKDKAKDRSLFGKISNGINELFGIRSAEANPLVLPVIKEILVRYGPQIIGALGIGKVITDLNRGEPDGGQATSIFEKRKHDSGTKPQPSKFKDTAISGMPDPDDDEFARFKKKDGSNYYECEKAESPQWKSLKPYRDNIKTNGLSGKDKRYYQWDNLHKEIEMYDQHGKPIDALDPVTGRLKNKDVSAHIDLKLK